MKTKLEIENELEKAKKQMSINADIRSRSLWAVYIVALNWVLEK